MATLYRKILVLAVVFFIVQLSSAQEQASKTITDRFPITENGELQLENKYGNISVYGWEKNEVAVSIDIVVNRRKKEDATELLNRINAKIKTSSSLITISSEVSKKNTGWFADFFNRTNPIDADRSRVQINYEVFLPKEAKLKVTNRFGDLIIEDWSGELNTFIEHGDLWLNNDLTKAEIILKFGKVKAKDLNYASLNLKNGELDMQDAKSLRINSSGTEMRFNKVNTLEMYSNKDILNIGNLGTLYGSMKFTTFNVERLYESVDVNLKITDFKVREISNALAEIQIEQESSDIQLDVQGFPHRFEATLEQGVVRLPKSFENVDSNLLDKGSRLREIRATFGKSKSGLISINGVKGIVTINDK